MNLDDLIADVNAADAEGPLCDLWTTPLHSLSVRFLAELDLVKPIKTRVPACSDHFCPIAEACSHRERFETGGPGRSGVKAKLTASGQRAFESRTGFLKAIEEHRIVRVILDGLNDGPRSMFALHAALLRACYTELEESGAIEKTVFTRGDLRLVLEALETLGRLHWDRTTGHVTPSVMEMIL